MNKAFDLYPRKCKQCGKKFEAGVDYAYKHKKDSKKEYWYFCSWHCLREYTKTHEKKVTA